MFHFQEFIIKEPSLSGGVKIILKDLLNLSENNVTIDLIQSLVCKFFKISKNEIITYCLTAVISLLSIITVPLIIFTSADMLGITEVSQNISMTGIALKMFLVVTVPVILGMIIRKFAENFISSKVEIFNKLNIVLFIVFFVAAFYEERENILSFIKQAGLIALILNISMMVIAYYIAKAFASGVKQMKCIALECGLQNGTLALFVSTQIFGTDILYALPTGAYALIMYITGFIFIYFLRKSN
ncbi:MAG: hypothetical protein CM15mV118_430 [uncultured marine virus]|nr:MAG: hypothetical protein CM15mV118_430 [uncultured marine virus]